MRKKQGWVGQCRVYVESAHQTRARSCVFLALWVAIGGAAASRVLEVPNDLWSIGTRTAFVGARSLQPRPQFAAMLLSFALSFALTVTAAQIAPCADDACIRRALSADDAVAVTGVAGLAAARRRRSRVGACLGKRPSGARDVTPTTARCGAPSARAPCAPPRALWPPAARARGVPLCSRGWSRRRRNVLRAVEPLRAQRLGADASEQVADGEQLEHLHLYVPPRADVVVVVVVAVVVVGGGGRPGAVGRAEGAAGAQAAHRRRPLHRARPRAVAPPGRFGRLRRRGGGAR